MSVIAVLIKKNIFVGLTEKSMSDNSKMVADTDKVFNTPRTDKLKSKGTGQIEIVSGFINSKSHKD